MSHETGRDTLVADVRAMLSRYTGYDGMTSAEADALAEQIAALLVTAHDRQVAAFERPAGTRLNPERVPRNPYPRPCRPTGGIRMSDNDPGDSYGDRYRLVVLMRNSGPDPYSPPTDEQRAKAILDSEWLAERDARVAAETRESVLDEVERRIRDRKPLGWVDTARIVESLRGGGERG